MDRVLLTIAFFPDTKRVRALGAKFEGSTKTWYINSDADSTPFAKWLPSAAKQTVVITWDHPEESFGNAIREAGLLLEGDPVMDCTWHRVAVEGDRKNQTSGAYRGFLDGCPAGSITNFKNGEQPITWTASRKDGRQECISREELEARALDAKNRRDAVQRDQALAVLAAAAVAKERWSKFSKRSKTGDESHPYLQRKGVQNFGCKFDDANNLIVPGRDVMGELHTYQWIGKDAKGYLASAKKIGCMHVLGDIVPDGRIVIAEGYATAATVHMATGEVCVCAFDSSNLPIVVGALRARYPDAQIVIAADNDHAREAAGKKNVGLLAATAAAAEHDALCLAPQFVAGELGSDFNDLAALRGIHAVKVAFDF